MPSFDVVSEVDRQEVRNAVDQAQREIATRFDFKNTDSSIELSDTDITLRSATRCRSATYSQSWRGVSPRGTASSSGTMAMRSWTARSWRGSSPVTRTWPWLGGSIPVMARMSVV
ncbi:MAG: DUF520 family protein, partial [Acidimicrobiia bacterium]